MLPNSLYATGCKVPNFQVCENVNSLWDWRGTFEFNSRVFHENVKIFLARNLIFMVSCWEGCVGDPVNGMRSYGTLPSILELEKQRSRCLWSLNSIKIVFKLKLYEVEYRMQC